MNQVDLENQVSSEDEGLGTEKLVPVSEAIRYRKRAQTAEKQVSELNEQLHKSREQNEQLSGQFEAVKFEQELTGKLTAAGVNDLEAAILLAKARVDTSEDGDIDSVVEQLKKEKGYLFSDIKEPVAASRTSGVREKTTTRHTLLAKAAEKAAATGNRTDVQEYLKARRQYL